MIENTGLKDVNIEASFCVQIFRKIRQAEGGVIPCFSLLCLLSAGVVHGYPSDTMVSNS